MENMIEPAVRPARRPPPMGWIVASIASGCIAFGFAAGFGFAAMTRPADRIVIRHVEAPSPRMWHGMPMIAPAPPCAGEARMILIERSPAEPSLSILTIEPRTPPRTP